jgi:hypothetical protein
MVIIQEVRATTKIRSFYKCGGNFGILASLHSSPAVSLITDCIFNLRAHFFHQDLYSL